MVIANITSESTEEHARLIRQHHAIVSLTHDRLIHVPVTSPGVVFDVGCGTGIVTRSLASRFPKASHVYGIDLNRITPQTSDSSMPNLAFIEGDFRKLGGVDARLPFASVDFLYSRMLLCGMTDWPGYVQDAFRMLRPGGWAEMADYVEDTFYTDNRCVPRDDWEWLRAIREGEIRKGLDLDAGLNVPEYMRQAGFVDIQTWRYSVPFSRKDVEGRPETKEIVDLSVGDAWGLYWHMIPRLLEGSEYSQEDVERLRRDAQRDLGDEESKEQLYCVTIGRKPQVRGESTTT